MKKNVRIFFFAFFLGLLGGILVRFGKKMIYQERFAQIKKAEEIRMEKLLRFRDDKI